MTMDKTKQESPRHTKPGSADKAKVPVEVPRFVGLHIPPIDRLLIRIIPPVLIVAVMIWVLANPVGAAAVISEMRTFVTGRFTWLFILYSAFTVVVCIWLASSKVGK